MLKISTSLLCTATLLAACSTAYTPPEQSGLVGVRPFPTPESVCMVIGESAATVDFLDHTEKLIGCPSHETGAIGDLIAGGSSRVGQVGSWVLLSEPL